MADNKIIWTQHKLNKIIVGLVSPDTLLDDRSGIIHTMQIRQRDYENMQDFQALVKCLNVWTEEGHKVRLLRDISSYQLLANLIGSGEQSATVTVINERVEEVEFHYENQKVMVLSPSSTTVNDLHRYLISCIDKKII